MKQCSNCNLVREDFSPQKTKPGKLYAWCDECRVSTVKVPNMRKHKGYKMEMKELKEKAIKLRAFTPEQCAELKAKHEAGTSLKALATETGKSINTVSKAVKGYL